MDNLENLSLKELRALRNRIDQAIESFEDRRRRDAMAAAEQVAREHGFSLADLTGGKATRKSGAKAAAKYANPQDPTQTWSGRGRRPAWVVEHLDADKPLEDLAI
ncbi:MAG: H-NS histone family protein [Paracoccus sp. (in: a-proteobacteria)]|nr:H-NS histone family protein [Paracoccus sp. (in: a-proteobacteria)]